MIPSQESNGKHTFVCAPGKQNYSLHCRLDNYSKFVKKKNSNSNTKQTNAVDNAAVDNMNFIFFQTYCFCGTDKHNHFQCVGMLNTKINKSIIV